MKAISSILTFLFFVQCEKLNQNVEISGVSYLEGSSIVESYVKKEVVNHTLSDKKCTKGISDLGKVEIYLYNEKYKKIMLSEEDLSGVKANPISSKYINSVIAGYHEKKSMNDCVKAGKKMNCSDFMITEKSRGKKVHLCKRSYPKDSLENHILSAVASVNETIECVFQYLPKTIDYPKINIKVFPVIEKSFKLKTGEVYTSYATDNAFYASAHGNKAFSSIEFLPHSKMTLKKTYLNQEFTFNLGVGSHETGHFVYSLLTGAALSFIHFQAGLRNHHNYRISPHESLMEERNVDTKLVYGAFNEGMADAISTLCFYENDSANLRLGSEADIRDSRVDALECRECKKKQSIIVEKTLTADRIRHFFSKKTTKGKRGDADDKDIHHVGSLLIFGLFKYWEALGIKIPDYLEGETKLSADEKKDLHKARQMLVDAMKNIGQVIPNNEPQIYMDDLVYAMIKGGLKKDAKKDELYIEDRVCDVFKKYFPVNFIGFQNKFSCR